MRILSPLLFLILSISPVYAATVKVDFSKGLTDWEEKIFDGSTQYRLVEDDGRQVLEADSLGNASALIRWVDIDPAKFSKIRWRWKVSDILPHGQAGTRAGDDYPARIYIVFDSWLPNYARSINYIWASRLPKEEVVTSPYYRRSKMLAVETGAAKAGDWVIVERDLLDDYRRAFGGRDVPQIRAVALMSDGDDTGDSVTAWYDWIEFLE